MCAARSSASRSGTPDCRSGGRRGRARSRLRRHRAAGWRRPDRESSACPLPAKSRAKLNGRGSEVKRDNRLKSPVFGLSFDSARTPHLTLGIMLPTRLLRVAVVAFAVALVACGDLHAAQGHATANVVARRTRVYRADRHARRRPERPSLLRRRRRAPTRTFNFDVAFDIDAAGTRDRLPGAHASPARSRRTAQARRTADGARRVRVAARRRRRPATTRSTVRRHAGQRLAMQLHDAHGSACYSLDGSHSSTPSSSSTASNASTRSSTSAPSIDPNCGYRSLVPDSIPKN